MTILMMNATNNDINHKQGCTALVKKIDIPNILNQEIKLKCMICYDEVTDTFNLDCCITPIICVYCIDHLEKPICPFCRSPIKSLLDNPKYRLSSSCPTHTDHLTNDLIRNMAMMYDDNYFRRRNLSNRMRISNYAGDPREMRQFNRERRMENIALGNIIPYSRSRMNSENRNEINEGLDIYYSELEESKDNTDDYMSTIFEVD